MHVSYHPGELYDGTNLWAVNPNGDKVRTIPFDVPCNKCDATTWRLELGAADRHWGGCYVCAACAAASRKPWIGLRSGNGKEEWNARLALGDATAESLTVGSYVTLTGHDGKPRKWLVTNLNG